MDYYKLKVLNNRKKIIVVILFICLLGGGLFYYFNYYVHDEKKDNNVDEIILEDAIQDSIVNKEIYVDIKGYINKPGVYSFSKDENARVNDLIIKAGGLKKEADTSILNLSKKLEDEMTIIIYSKDEVNNIEKSKSELEEKLSLCEAKIKNNACIEQVSLNSDLVNINTASKEVLMTLSGIGESKALAIIAYREQNPFTKIEDIKNVDGIGESIFENIKDNITI